MLKIGVVYPQTEFGNDPEAIRDYVQTAEGSGFSHILAYEHVLGANPERPGGWDGPYTFQSSFQEPFVLFSFMAGVTQKIEFTTGILILPQRQTALVAKQAATLDVLSKGRLRIGVGLGWNQVEYACLNQTFSNRGRRIEEQIELMRLLWTQPLVTFEGRWHSIPDAGINPLPVQRPIPIWFGGHASAVLQRAARLGDGWMPNYKDPQDALPSIETIHNLLLANNRQPHLFGIEARIPFGDGNPSFWEKLLIGWEKAGATHATLNTMGFGLKNPSDHIAAIQTFMKEMDGSTQ